MRLWIGLAAAAMCFGCSMGGIRNDTSSVTFSKQLSVGDVFNTSTDVARSMGLPPVTKIDKENGYLEFGSFTMMMTGADMGGECAMQVHYRPGAADVTTRFFDMGWYGASSKAMRDAFDPKAAKADCPTLLAQFKDALAARLK